MPPLINSGIDENSIQMDIDGKVVSHYYTTYTDGKTGLIFYQPETPLTGGVHIITVQVNDNAGNSATKSWSFNSIWPQFSNFQPPDDAVINNPTLTISAQLTGGLEILDFIQDVSLKLNGKQVDSVYNPSTRVVSYTPTLPLPDQTHNVDVEVRFAIPCPDSITCWLTEQFSNLLHLNFLITAASWSFTTTTALPEIINLHPPDGTIINTPNVQISADAIPKGSTEIDPTSIIMKVDGNIVPHEFDNNHIFYTATLPDGLHTVYLRVADTAGNQREIQWSFTIDSQTPVFFNPLPVDGTITILPVPLISVSVVDGEPSSGIDSASLKMKLNSKLVDATYNETLHKISYTCVPPLTENKYEVYVEIKDNAENIATYSWSFIVDYTPPTVTILQPQNDAILNTNSVVIQAKVTDATSGIDTPTLQLIIDGTTYLDYNYNEDASILFYETTLSDGEHTITIKVKDKAGNGATVSSTFKIDTQPPILSNPIPPDGANLKISQLVISIIAKDPLPGSGVDPSFIRMWLNSESVSCTYDPLTGLIVYTPVPPLTENRYQVNLHIRDKVGNDASIMWQFTVDKTPPTITNFTPPNNSTTGGTEVLISATITDNLSGINLALTKMQVDLRLVPATFNEGTGMLSYQTTLQEGIHNVTVEAVDYAGNIASASWLFKVDTTPPTIEPITPAAGTSVCPRPIITAYLTDTTIIPPSPGAGVDETTIQLSIDGKRVSHHYCTYIDGRGLVYYQPDTPLTGGPHTVTIEASDKVGNHVIKSWTFNSIYPEFTNFQPPDSSFINNPKPLISTTLQGGEEILDAVYEPEMKLNGNIVPAEFDSTTRTIYYLPPNNLPEGLHNVYVRLKFGIKYEYEAVLNWLIIHFSTHFVLEFTLAETSWAFTIDTTPPTITNLKPTPDSFINLSTPTISAIATDQNPNICSGIDPMSIEMLIDGNKVLPDYNETTGLISYETTLLDGPHTIKISLKDKATNSADVTWAFFIDTVPPVIINLLPPNNAMLNQSPSKITATITDSQPSSGINENTIQMRLNGNIVAPTFNHQTGELIYILPSPLPDGWYTITIDIQDKAGNSASTATSTFLIDTQPPIIAILQPQPDSFTNTTPTIKCKLTDPEPTSGINLTTIILKLDNVQLLHEYDEATALITYTVHQPLPEGSHTITLDAMDNVANQGTQAKVTFTVDGTPPQIIFIYPQPEQQLSEIPTKIRVGITDAEPSSGININSLIMRIDNNPVSAEFDTLTNELVHIPPEPLSPGSHSIKVEAKDNVDNFNIQETNFYIDNQPPVISNLQPLHGDSITDYTPTISCSITDPEPASGVKPASISVTLNNQIQVFDYDEVTGILTVPITTPLPEATYTVVVNVSDNMQNQTTFSWHFKIAIPPTIEIIYPLQGGVTNPQEEIRIKVTDDTGIDVDSLLLRINNEQLHIIGFDYLNNIATFSVPWVSGICNAYFEAKDYAGNLSSKSWSFIVDVDSPQVVDQSPSLYTNQLPVKLWIILSDGLGGSGINTSIDKLSLNMLVLGAVSKLPPHEITVIDAANNTIKITYIIPETIGEADLWIYCYFEDKAGNSVGATWGITIDFTQPTITPIKPLPNAIINKPEIEIKVEDNLSKVNTEKTVLKLNNIQYAFEYDYLSQILSTTITISDGNYTLSLYAEDRAGNSSTKSWNFTLNTTLSDEEVAYAEIRDVTITPQAINPSQGETFSVSYTLTKPAKVTIKLIRIDDELKEGPEIKTIIDEVQSPGSHTISNITGTDLQGNILQDSAYKLKFQAIDLSTNTVFILKEETKKPRREIIHIEGELIPSKNHHLRLTYTVDRLSLLLLAIGVKDGPLIRYVAFWEPRRAATYTEVWDGRDDNGNIVPPRNYNVQGFLVGLPNTAIIMDGGTPIISNLPTTELSINVANNETVTIPYTLSELCNVTIQVFDEFNAYVMTIEDNASKSAGDNSFSWNGKLPDGTPVKEGVYSISIDAIDSQGFEAKRKYIVVKVITPLFRVDQDFVTIIPNRGYNVTQVTEDNTPLPPLQEHYRQQESVILTTQVLDKTTGPHQFRVIFITPTNTTFSMSKTVYFVEELDLTPDTITFKPTTGEQATFSYNLPFDDKVTAVVFQKLTGCDVLQMLQNPSQAIKVILNKEPQSAGTNTFTWDGKDAQGDLLPAGKYSIMIYLSDPDKEYARYYMDISEVTIE